MNQNNRNKRKKYYQSGNFNKKPNFGHETILQPNLTGFLVTCNHKEQESLRETYNIINELIEDIPDDLDGNGDDDGKDGDNIEDAIAKEVDQLKKESKQERKLKQVNTKCKNILFVQLNVHKNVDSVGLITNLFDNVTETGKQPARFIQRIIPIETTCKGTIDGIEKCVESMLTIDDSSKGSRTSNKLTELEETGYQIIAKVRNNSDMTRTDVIESVAAIVKRKRPGWKVNFDTPTVTLSIDVLIKTACISFLPNYFEFKKYNLIEYSMKIKNQKTAEETDLDAKDNDQKDIVKDDNDLEKDDEEDNHLEKDNHV